MIIIFNVNYYQLHILIVVVVVVVVVAAAAARF